MLQNLANMWSWWSSINRSVTYEIALIILISLSTLFIFMINWLYNGKLPPSPPGPYGLPILGYLPFLGPDPRRTFENMARKYGPIFKVQLGTKECIVVTSPSLAREVLKDQDALFANRDPIITAKIAAFGATEIAFSDYGPEWRKVKKIFVSEMLSHASLEASYHFRRHHVTKMMSKIYEMKGEPINVGDLIFSTVMGSVMSMVWGETVREDEEGDVGIEFRSLTSEFMRLLGTPNISDYVPAVARFDLQGIGRKMKSLTRQVEKLFDIAINQCIANDSNNGVGQKDFLGYLLQLTKNEDPTTSLTLPQVKAMLMDVVIGGMDLTAATVEWAMAEMLQHPEVMQKIQDELTTTVGQNTNVEETHLPHLKYLNATVKEVLRLHVPAPLLLPHRPNKSTIIGGYYVPKNSLTVINAYAIHRDPQNWDDPLTFQPQRFLNGALLRDQHQYLPFGYGRRMCPGMALADRTLMHVLASLLHGFQWKLPDGEVNVDLSEIVGLVVKKKKSLILVPVPRLPNSELYQRVT